jgi:TonB family protein
MKDRVLIPFPIVFFAAAAILGIYSLQVKTVNNFSTGSILANEKLFIKTIVKPAGFVASMQKPAVLQQTALKPGSQIMPIVPPAISFKVLPAYPQTALSAGSQGTVLLSVLVGLGGQAQQIQVKASSGAADLDQSAIDAVKQWKFSPASQAGAVLSSWLEIPVCFQILNNN